MPPLASQCQFGLGGCGHPGGSIVNPISEVKGQPLIKTRSPLATPKGFEERRPALEAWVIRRTNSHINLSDPDYRIVGPADNQRERQRALKFAQALQREYLHFHNWDGTPRQDDADFKEQKPTTKHT